MWILIFVLFGPPVNIVAVPGFVSAELCSAAGRDSDSHSGNARGDANAYWYCARQTPDPYCRFGVDQNGACLPEVLDLACVIRWGREDPKGVRIPDSCFERKQNPDAAPEKKDGNKIVGPCPYGCTVK